MQVPDFSHGKFIYQLLPPLSKAEFEALVESIKESGVLQPVIVDENGEILDGHHRFYIATNLGIDCPIKVIEGMTEEEKRIYSRKINTARRNLSSKQKRNLIADVLKESPDRSNNSIAKELGVSDTTVASVRATNELLNSSGNRVGDDGKIYDFSSKVEEFKGETSSDNAVYSDNGIVLYHSDCMEVMANIPDDFFDSVVCDPPYELGFYREAWDSSGVAHSSHLWEEVLRVLKPGGHLVAFGGSRTYHRLTCAIEDAGFEIRDSLHWIYGKGYPKSVDVAAEIDRSAGVEGEVYGTAKGKDFTGSFFETKMKNGNAKEFDLVGPSLPESKKWEGWGTALLPSYEPIVLARKKPNGILARNLLEFGAGAINIDGCRYGEDIQVEHYYDNDGSPIARKRWPRNLFFDEESVKLIGEKSEFFDTFGANPEDLSSFKYVNKPTISERFEQGVANTHPTIKPIELMRWLVRLVTPVGGVVFDPFAGSGTTLVASLREGRHCMGTELTGDYVPIILGRIEWALENP